MEKLTEDKLRLNAIRFGIRCNFPQHCGEERTKEATDFLTQVFDRLTELEDKLESGLMVELPCKVGDYLYPPAKENIKYQVLSVYYAEELEHNERTKFIRRKIECLVGNYCTVFDWCDIGKTVFLTQAEAEAKLKEATNE